MKTSIFFLSLGLSFVARAADLRVVCHDKAGTEVKLQFDEALVTIPFGEMPEFVTVAFQTAQLKSTVWTTAMYGIINYPEARAIDFYEDVGRQFISFRFPWETKDIFVKMKTAGDFQFDGQCQREN